MKKVYIAGPDVFYQDSVKIGKKYKKILKEVGLKGLYPLDNKCETSKEIVIGNMKLIDEADIVVANCNPFRGFEMDSGTAFEIGYAIAKHKEVFCYMRDVSPMVDKIGKTDKEGAIVEDFGYPLNIMIAENVTIVQGNFNDCVEEIKKTINFKP